MIRVRRGEEPAGLNQIKADELDRVRSAIAGSGYSREVLGDRYREVAEYLWRQQGHKCRYCEHNIRLRFNDVEHFRPAIRYWWLAWSWTNLLYACPACNRTAKNDAFPLSDESTRLKPEQAAPGAEVPLLLDPSCVHPRRHIRFELKGTDPDAHWLAMPRNGSVFGAASIARDGFNLNAPDLVELRDQFVQTELQPDIHRMLDAAASENPTLLRAEWNRYLALRSEVTTRFRALSLDVLEWSVEEPIRRHWGLDLPAYDAD